MRRFVETMRRSWVFSSIITVALGVVLLLYPDTTSTVLCYGVGAVLLFHGMLDLVRYFTRQEGEFFLRYELAAGIILCAVGTGVFTLVGGDGCSGADDPAGTGNVFKSFCGGSGYGYVYRRCPDISGSLRLYHPDADWRLEETAGESARRAGWKIR